VSSAFAKFVPAIPVTHGLKAGADCAKFALSVKTVQALRGIKHAQ
jgi:hypothetical protein